MEIGPQQTTAPAYKHIGNASDREYDEYLKRLQARFLSRIHDAAPLFTTSATGLYDAFLGGFPESERQYHTCNACRHFVERYGGLVVIGEDGRTTPAFWDADDAFDPYLAPVQAVAKLVRRADVTGPFLSNLTTWGEPVTGIWTHLSLQQPASRVYRGSVLLPHQVMAEKVQDYQQVSRALAEFSPEHVDLAVKLLKSDQLYRSEKVLGQAEWLQRLHAARSTAKAQNTRKNVTWLAVAKAPAGFCHPRASMIGTLLEDIAAGKSYEDVARAFAAKMHPLQYQRPQAAPALGTIKQAEELFAKLGLAAALRRRIARLDEVTALWRPPVVQPAEKPAGGIFSHLTPKGSAPAEMETPAITMTWEKFARTVLPDAIGIELRAPSHGNYTALVTAVDPEAPPILQWDRPEQRNPVSWYVWHGGSPARQWGLSGGAWTKVTAIADSPPRWYGGDSTHHGKSLYVLVEGARETRVAGAALFPELLRSELHGVRSVIEAHSRSATMEGLEDGSACGLMLSAGNTSWDAVLRVTSLAGRQSYKLDRWD